MYKHHKLCGFENMRISFKISINFTPFIAKTFLMKVFPTVFRFHHFIGEKLRKFGDEKNPKFYSYWRKPV
jgi:hypothetical protein